MLAAVYGGEVFVPFAVELSEEALLSRYERHVRWCATCQKVYALTRTRLSLCLQESKATT